MARVAFTICLRDRWSCATSGFGTWPLWRFACASVSGCPCGWGLRTFSLRLCTLAIKCPQVVQVSLHTAVTPDQLSSNAPDFLEHTILHLESRLRMDWPRRTLGIELCECRVAHVTRTSVCELSAEALFAEQEYGRPPRSSGYLQGVGGAAVPHVETRSRSSSVRCAARRPNRRFQCSSISSSNSDMGRIQESGTAYYIMLSL